MGVCACVRIFVYTLHPSTPKRCIFLLIPTKQASGLIAVSCVSPGSAVERVVAFPPHLSSSESSYVTPSATRLVQCLFANKKKHWALTQASLLVERENFTQARLIYLDSCSGVMFLAGFSVMFLS